MALRRIPIRFATYSKLATNTCRIGIGTTRRISTTHGFIRNNFVQILGFAARFITHIIGSRNTRATLAFMSCLIRSIRTVSGRPASSGAFYAFALALAPSVVNLPRLPAGAGLRRTRLHNILRRINRRYTAISF